MRLRAIYQLALADMLERMRRYSFFITLLLTLLMTTLLVPDPSANYAAFTIDNHRGLYNAAWVGTTAALSTTLFLSFIGFYLVRNTITWDEHTGVGQILAGTPLTNCQYLAGKMLSNLMILTVITLLTALATPIMLKMRGEDRALDFWRLLSPFILITWPPMVVISALAILFEATVWLRGIWGHVLYFMIWAAVFTAPVLSNNPSIHTPLLDPIGYVSPIDSLRAAAQIEYPSINISDVGIGFTYNFTGKPFPIFHWSGMSWTALDVAARFLWMAIALLIPILAAPFFRRFDAVRTGAADPKPESVASPETQTTSPSADPDDNTGASVRSLSFGIGPTAQAAQRWRIGPALLAELRLMLKGVSRAFYAGAIGLVVASLVLPLEIARGVVLPILGILPLTIWSQLGSREQRYSTNQVVFAIAHPMRRHLPVTWLAGLLIAISLMMGMLIHFLISGDGTSALALLTGVVFVPTLALALGVWTESNKLFEIVYVVLWYIGPLQRFPYLDFLGVTRESTSYGVTFVFFLIFAFSGILAILGRERQLQM